ncbi:MAG: UDP-N-acetylmuramoyl-L-alanyl-D-glutamate--2,6-diaminopimelate ligase [Patescibacteria group bacterium]
MFKETFLEKVFDFGRKIIPRPVFEFFQPWYHGLLALSGAVIFGWPSRKIKVIGITGTKGKSTTVYLTTEFLEEAGSTGSPQAGYKVAAIGSLGYKIGDRVWPNNLKMTMPGRWKIQKFLAEAVKQGCQFAILEITSEGIKQKRHLGVKFDAAVFTNLEKEHIESHGSFEKYYFEKQRLFKRTKKLHILNADSEYVDLFSGFPAQKKIFYPVRGKDALRALAASNGAGSFIFPFTTHLVGEFNKYNILAAASVARAYGINDETIQKALDKIKSIPGRLEFIEARQDFEVVVDYAHTPGSLEAVYKTLKPEAKKLICVLGAAGGGRDKWKRPVFGQIAAKFCDEMILTNEDPYDENPTQILLEIKSGIPNDKFQMTKEVIDRKEAIRGALTLAQKNDIVVITGKGSETSMAVAKGKKIPWSDKDIVLDFFNSDSATPTYVGGGTFDEQK